MRKTGLIIALVILASTSGVVRAVDQQNLMLTNDQVEKIRNSCSDTQATLTTVHNTDAVARVNLGQQFRDVSNLLMAPMNSRVALNKLDGVALAATTVSYNNELKRFASLYDDYEKTVSSAMASHCYDQPIEFYDTLTLAMQKRALVHDSVTKLSQLMAQYAAQVHDLQKQVPNVGAGTP